MSTRKARNVKTHGRASMTKHSLLSQSKGRASMTKHSLLSQSKGRASMTSTSSINMADNPAIKKVSKKNALQIMGNIVPKSTSRLRIDVAVWKSALSMAENVDNQRMYPLQNLYNEIKMDARLTSQIQNRKLKTISAGFVIKNKSGEVDDDLTATTSKNYFFNQIISNIWDSITHGHTLLEFDFAQQYTCGLIPRQNVVPIEGVVLKDYTDDKGIPFRDAHEYGNWIVEHGNYNDLGLINKAVPHVIFKRFAQSCWSELCEIYGIPPRVMKTNTADPAALSRAKQMMTEIGAAAWYIIDDTEQIDWATATATNGEVYEKLIRLCNDEISMLISGVILGQDTENGNRSKETVSVGILEDLIEADKRMIEQVMQNKIMPALYQIGFLPSPDLTFAWDQVTDIAELWTRTKDILPFKNVDDEWIKDKFGIEVTGDRQQQQFNDGNNQLHPDFFY